MIKIYQTSEGLCVNASDLGKLLDASGYTVFGYVFCGYNNNILPRAIAEKYREYPYWDINYVKDGLEVKLKSAGTLAKLSKYKKARIEYLIDYLNRFIKETETKNIHPFCING